MNKEEKIAFSKLSKKERRDQARKLLFGDYKESPTGNIWGKKFSLFSLIGLSFIAVLAIVAVQTGRIDPQNLEEDSSYFYLEKAESERQKELVKDTLK